MNGDGRPRPGLRWEVIVTGRDEAQARALFQERYRNTPSLLTRQIEQRVIGGDWGASEGLLTRTGVVAAAASGLPFRAGSLDVIIHTDVLC